MIFKNFQWISMIYNGFLCIWCTLTEPSMPRPQTSQVASGHHNRPQRPSEARRRAHNLRCCCLVHSCTGHERGSWKVEIRDFPYFRHCGPFASLQTRTAKKCHGEKSVKNHEKSKNSRFEGILIFFRQVKPRFFTTRSLSFNFDFSTSRKSLLRNPFRGLQLWEPLL